MLHYSLLCSFTWMGIEAFHLYRLLCKVYNIYMSRYILKLCLVGWGLPAVVVSLIIAIKKDAYGLRIIPMKEANYTNITMCYITNEYNTLYYIANIGYLAVVFTFNTFMLGVTVVKLMSIRSTSSPIEKRRAWKDICTILGLSSLLGTTWGLAFFTFGPLSLPGLYFFCVLNSLQADSPLWSDKGCQKANETDAITVCTCDHMTAFAVLMVPINSKNWEILTVISYIGSGLSAVFTAISVLMYFIIRNPKQDHSTTIHVCLSAALYLLNMSFLLNEWLANMNQNGVCKAIAILMHYFLLCCFSWMAVEAIHLYLLMVKVFNTYIRHYIAKLSLFGWGIPAIIIGISVCVRNDFYGSIGVTIHNSTNVHCELYLINHKVPIKGIDSKNWEILTVISYIGTGLSAVFTAISVLMYFIIRNPKQDHSTTIHVCLSAALYLLNMSFLLNEWLANMNQNGVCKAIAILMHYFLLCCFSWMAVEAIHLYLLMVKVFNTYIRHYIAKLSLFGWVLAGHYNWTVTT
ncbi:UNVERIFIED_CONTAM: hypothetical protein FKN15_002067 [Acipenser sinensis]